MEEKWKKISGLILEKTSNKEVEMFLLYFYEQDVEETTHREMDIVKIPKNEFNSCYREREREIEVKMNILR